jgi:hypothetical protein
VGKMWDCYGICVERCEAELRIGDWVAFAFRMGRKNPAHV